MDGPQGVGVHVVRLHPVDAEEKRIYKYEYGEWFKAFDGVLEKDEEQQAEIDRLKILAKKKNRKIKKLMEDNYLNGGR